MLVKFYQKELTHLKYSNMTHLKYSQQEDIIPNLLEVRNTIFLLAVF